MKRWIVGLAVGAVFACLHVSIASAAIVVSSWSLGVYAADAGTGGGSEDVINGTVSFPFLATHTVANVGGSSASATYDFNLTDDGGGAWFIDFNFLRTGQGGSSARLNSHVFFEVTEESSVNANGIIATAGDYGQTCMDVKLRDYGVNPEMVYQSFQKSYETQDEVLTLGGMGGDYINTLSGHLPATLIPGHQYLIQWNVDLDTSWPDDGATAIGHLEFNFTAGGSQGAVPEPATLIIWSLLGALGMAGGWYRRYSLRRAGG